MMSSVTMNANKSDRIVYKLVLTGGPCSGKTTGSVRLSTFFENMGWKVYRVPETATTLFSGGIRFPDLDDKEADTFQENLLKVMLSIEKTYFDVAATCKKNCLIICDRGVMDAAAYMSKQSFERVLQDNKWNAVDLRDNRYNQVVHLVTAANGAEPFYNIEDNPCRTEGIELARELDQKTMESWVGHPYIDVIDNSTDFDTKMNRMIDCVCRRMGIDLHDRLSLESRKLKFLVKCLPPDDVFPSYQDFQVVHNYLVSANPKIQTRLRKRGQRDNWVYQYTIRRRDDNQTVEVRRLITHRDYVNFLAQRDGNHYTIRKTRRCFVWDNMYFQMDIYQKPSTPKCDGLILLETFTTLKAEEVLPRLPPWLQIVKNVTGDPEYSMYTLSKKTDSSFTTSNNYGHRLSKDPIGCHHYFKNSIKDDHK